MYSSIEEDERSTVISKCYWPLLNIAKNGIPVGVELSGITLESIQEIDPAWIDELKKLIGTGSIEIIGSGYSQIIGPLVPATINDWNHKIGLEVYQSLLGVIPKIALVNEMAYSGGIVEHYLNHGYEAIIMEWNNPRSSHPDWKNELRYYPQKVIGTNGEKLPLIWADSIAFQKFQRYAHGETSLREYLVYLDSHQSPGIRFFPLYASDAEVFDFRPGRFKIEASLTHNAEEWHRIETLFDRLNESDDFEFILPSEVIQNATQANSGKMLSLETTEQPIPVKKQAKYNITRWAVTGRNDLWLNTLCHKIFSQIRNADEEELWKKLCYFWSSDFRTHITDNRWVSLLTEIEQFCSESNIDLADHIKNRQLIDLMACVQKPGRYEFLSNSKLDVTLDLSKGGAIQAYKPHGQQYPLIGKLDHGYFDDIEYGVDYFSGHAIIERLGDHKITDISIDEKEIWKNTKSGEIVLSSNCENISFWKRFFLKEETLSFSNTISFSSKKKEIIHPFHFTLIPEAWDSESLYFATKNGGSIIETFPLTDLDFNHGDSHSFLITSKHGLGNTDGVMVIGDKDKELVFSVNLSLAFLIPSIFYKKMSNSKFLLRLVYSAQEVDETSREDGNEYSIMASINLCYVAHK